ncbi:hypothetical protein [uncultured Lamprocystis sp.]|uniref:hypothetical protein n=1 Tax=uncultured Lamprocystis sp. TaxID=543132 RepID=UPI0025F2AD0A|nr:hypothetical protein [uncultured Lamprocystis sp.]
MEALPTVEASPDPYDNDLLSIAAGGEADDRVTGDKPHLLTLGRYAGIKNRVGARLNDVGRAVAMPRMDEQERIRAVKRNTCAKTPDPGF